MRIHMSNMTNEVLGYGIEESKIAWPQHITKYMYMYIGFN